MRIAIRDRTYDRSSSKVSRMIVYGKSLVSVVKEVMKLDEDGWMSAKREGGWGPKWIVRDVWFVWEEEEREVDFVVVE